MSLISLLTAVCISCINARTVKVDVQAPWPVFASSPVMEIAEFFHEQSPDLFWQWLESTCQYEGSHFNKAITAGDIGRIRELSYEILSSTDMVTNTEEFDLIKTSVSAGMYLPAVRFFESVASPYGQPCSSSGDDGDNVDGGNMFIVAYPEETILCSMEEAREYIEAFPDRGLKFGPKTQHAWEHVSSLGKSIAASDVHLAMYDVLGSDSFCAAHGQMKRLLSSPSKVGVAYSVRHGFGGNPIVLPTAAGNAPYDISTDTDTDTDTNQSSISADSVSAGLYGYGVYLDIKNMEYTTVDDGIKGGNSEGADSGNNDADVDADADANALETFPVDEELSGINFHKLHQRFKDHKAATRVPADAGVDEDLDAVENINDDSKKKSKAKKSKKGKKEVKPAEPLLDTLTAFRKHLLSVRQGEGKASGGMKVWNMRDLGLQTVQSIRTAYVKHRTASSGDGADAAESVSPGSKLMKIVQNFPSMASTLADVKVTKRLRNQVATWHGESMRNFDGEPHTPPAMQLPNNHLFINGLAVSLDAPSFNVFDIIKIVTKEHGYVGSLNRLLSTYFTAPEAVQSVMAATKRIASLIGTDGKKEGGQVGQQQAQARNPFSTSEVVRIDVSKGAKHAVAFVNNLEKDAMYKGWSKSLKQLGQPSWNLILVARNLYTCVSVIKPLTFAGAHLVTQMNELIEGGMPIRFGYVLDCEDREEWSGAWALGGANNQRRFVLDEQGEPTGTSTNMDICVLYSKIRTDKGHTTAWEFLSEVAAEVLDSSTVDVIDDSFDETDDDSMFGGFFGNGHQQRRVLKYSEDGWGNIPVSHDFVSELYAKTTVSSSAAGWNSKSETMKKSILELLAAPYSTATTTETATETDKSTLDALTPPATAAATAAATGYTVHSEYATIASAYIEARGLLTNTYSLNGIVVETSGSAGVGPPGVPNMQNGLMQLMGREQYIMTQAYAMGIIGDKTRSLFSAVLQHAQAYTRYHPLLFPDEGEEAAAVPYINLLQNSRAAEWVEAGHFVHTTTSSASASAKMRDTTSATILMSIPSNVRGLLSAAAVYRWLDVQSRADLNSASEGQVPAYRTRVSPTLSSASDERLTSLLSELSSQKTKSGTVPLTHDEQNAILLTHIQTLVLTKAADLGPLVPRVLRVALRYIGRATKEVWEAMEVEIAEAFTAADSMEAGSVTVTGEIEDSTAGVISDLQMELTHLLKHSNSAVVDADIYSDAKLIATVLENSRQMQSLLATQEDSDQTANSVSVIYNSRVFTQSTAKPLHPLDMEMFTAIEDERVTHRLTEALSEAVELDGSSGTTTSASVPGSQLFIALASFIGSYSNSDTGKRYDVRGILSENDFAVGNTSFMVEIPSSYSVEQKKKKQTAGQVDVVFLFNPLSKAGQRGVSLIPLFESHLHVAQTLVMVPVLEISEFPLQNFYRFVLPYTDTELTAVSSEKHKHTPSFTLKRNAAIFQDLPAQHTLTVRTDVPESWNVQTLKAVQDIDNLRCVTGGAGNGVAQCGDSYEPQYHMHLINQLADSSDSFSETESDTYTGLSSVDSYLMDQDLTRVTYSLKNFIVPGQCFEEGPRPRPPAGLQLLLRSDATTPPPSQDGYVFREPIVQSDTLVMNNLGYFQLQANPGLWSITLAPGRADALYTIADAANARSDGNGTEAVPARSSFPVVINSFGDSVKRLFVSKRPGLESIGLLDDAAAIYDLDDQQQKNEARKSRRAASSHGSTAAGMWKSISSLWKQSGGDSKYFSSQTINSLTTGSEVAAGEGDEDDVIHVFSLATGHMYERLLRIMMLSVTKRTSVRVKFWLFENYLSPTFKNSAEQMSKEYGFEVAYVTYKWPSWLTQQSEKQRIIWGYKILFLDVLFPIDVKRIIYVDADQVLRTDLKELWETDMEGKPYGYVPFCSSRNETLGFQFWRSGFWKDHLRGLPYHISALYLVDLENFRKHAVGDILRSTYDG